MRIGASLSIGAESGQIEHAEPPADMPLRAERAQFTESSVVVFAWGKPGFFAHMLIEAIVTVGTVSGAREGLAFGHSAQVVFMQILALHSLLAETFQEMFANQRSMCSGWRQPGGGGRRCRDA